MKISVIKRLFLACKRSTQIECSGIDKDTAEGIAVSLGYVVQDFYGDLEFILDGEAMGSWLETGDLSLFIDEGSEAEVKFNSLGGDNWIKKVLTGDFNPV